MKTRRNKTPKPPHFIHVNPNTGRWEKILWPDDFVRIETIDAEKITFINGDTYPLLHPTDHAYNKRIVDADPNPRAVLPPLDPGKP
jgi:hypothetical protein